MIVSGEQLSDSAIHIHAKNYYYYYYILDVVNCVDSGFCFNPVENIDGLFLQEIVYFVQIANCVLPFAAMFQISVVFSKRWSCIFWPVRHAHLSL